MDATANFSLRFPRASDSKVETPGWVLSRQVLQRIATRITLVSEAIGFLVLGILIIVNRHQVDLNGFSGGSSFAMVGSISALLVGAVFFVAACLIAASEPDVLPRCRPGANPPVGLSLGPSQRANASPSPYPWRARLECPRGHKRNRTKRAQSEFRLARDYHVVLNPELQAFLVNVGLRKGSRPSLAMSQRLDELRGTPMEKIISELETSLQRYPPIKPGTPDPYVSPK